MSSADYSVHSSAARTASSALMWTDLHPPFDWACMVSPCGFHFCLLDGQRACLISTSWKQTRDTKVSLGSARWLSGCRCLLSSLDLI